MKTIIETQRLILREMTPDDLPALHSILQDDDVMYAYEGAFSDEEVDGWLSNRLASYQSTGYSLWAVVLKETREMIGQCGLTNQTPIDETILEVGYLFAKKYWGQGYASEAADAAKTYAFETLGTDALYAIIRTSNRPSRNVAKRLGMHCVKYFVKHYRGVDMPHFLYRVTRDQSIHILRLDEHPEFVPACAAWIYGQWGTQAGGSLDGALRKFSEKAAPGQLPISFIAIHDNKPAGTISLWTSDHHIDDIGPWLAALYVHPFHRKKAVAMALIDRVIDEAYQRGDTSLYLVTEDAGDLYRRFGFEDVRKLVSDYGEATLMQLTLNGYKITGV